MQNRSPLNNPYRFTAVTLLVAHAIQEPENFVEDYVRFKITICTKYVNMFLQFYVYAVASVGSRQST